MKVDKKEPELKVQPIESVVLEANEQLELPSQEEKEDVSMKDECQSKSLANNVGNMS